ncbi:MAG: DUF2752 domain-containing protein [Kineosporiaceae bacterium]|nr:DUF2752 domain-containing protein [Kineosporiaceae bacterium]
MIDLSRRALPRWVAPAATGVAVAAAGALLTVRDPRVPGAYAICPSLALTGTYCPGCGSLRAVNRLLAGDLAGAVGYNVLAVAVVPVLVYAWVAWALPPRLTARWPRVGSAPSRAIYAFAVLVGLYWVARNLPWEPFSWLAPSP